MSLDHRRNFLKTTVAVFASERFGPVIHAQQGASAQYAYVGCYAARGARRTWRRNSRVPDAAGRSRMDTPSARGRSVADRVHSRRRNEPCVLMINDGSDRLPIGETQVVEI